MAIAREIKVGVFVFLGIAVLGVVVFLIGDERHLFSRNLSYRTAFHDVQGLKAGATVRTNGIDVGTVTSVWHSDDLSDSRIHVQMRVTRSEALRLRQDAYARIVNKGLLGDKMLEIVAGTGVPRADADADIRGEDPTDISSFVTEIGNITAKAESVLGNLDRLSKDLADETLNQDLRSAMHSAASILKNVAEGDGYAHRLIADPAEAQRVSRAIESLERTSSELAQTSAEAHQLVARINHGPGFAHDVVYGEEGTRAMSQLGSAAGELAATLKGIREGNGIARGALFGDGEQQQIVGNLNAMSRDLRDLVAGVKAGRGTLGALLVDPSVYEDLKLVLGNVQRNDVLRALVRYSIKRDEKKPEVEVRDPGSAPASNGH